MFQRILSLPTPQNRFIAQSGKVLALAAAIGMTASVLTSCSTAPVSQQKPIVGMPSPGAMTKKTSSQVLQEEIREAQQAKSWNNYLELTQLLWSKASPDNQLAIEYQIWQTLKDLPQAEKDKLISDPDTSPDLMSWLDFVKATELHPIWQKPALADLKRFNPSALFNQHLNQALSQQLLNTNKVQQVAVFLPLTGPYKNIAMQIRDGIIRNQLAHAPNVKLAFYNTNYNPSEPNQILSTYQTAKQNGADVILGPLQKENIDILTKKLNAIGGDDSVITLNDAFGIQHFNFISNSEALQIATKLCQKHYKNIAILTSTTPADSNLAVQIADYWQQVPDHKLTLKSYPATHPKLREALGSVINETYSQARKNNLQWLFKENLSFTPRTRKDLDAIVLLGNARQVAVFKPQFAFFELQLPVYGSSKLTPINLDKTEPNKDLANVIFPTFKAALKKTNLASTLEAYGWDSFTLATQKYRLGPNICLNAGMLGKLSKQDNEFDYKMSWARYNSRGEVVPLAESNDVDESHYIDIPQEPSDAVQPTKVLPGETTPDSTTP
jgi:hypothetical protein